MFVYIGPVGRQWSLPKSTDWFDNIMPVLPEATFKRHFRVGRETFNMLVNDLHPYLIGEPNNYRENIAVEKKVAIGLFRLGSSAELRVIAELFGVGKSTVHKIQYEFTSAVIAHYSDEIKWPQTDRDLNRCARDFEEIWNYPCCIGSVDGCHIPVSPPVEDAVDYYNYKGWYSVILLAVCDARYRFTYINVGTPGKSNDAFIFKYSSLYRILNAQTDTLTRLGSLINGIIVPFHLIGDAAFPLLEIVMKPFPHGVQDAVFALFNYRLSRARRVIENAFGRLKARFRIICKRMDLNVANVNETVTACILLHNLFEKANENIPNEWYGQNDPWYPLFIPNGANRAARRAAINIRIALAHHLYENEHEFP